MGQDCEVGRFSWTQLSTVPPARFKTENTLPLFADLPFPIRRFGFSFPTPRGALREGGIDFGVVRVFAKEIIDRFLERQRWANRVPLVGFDEDDFTRRMPQA